MQLHNHNSKFNMYNKLTGNPFKYSQLHVYVVAIVITKQGPFPSVYAEGGVWVKELLQIKVNVIVTGGMVVEAEVWFCNVTGEGGGQNV